MCGWIMMDSYSEMDDDTPQCSLIMAHMADLHSPSLSGFRQVPPSAVSEHSIR